MLSVESPCCLFNTTAALVSYEGPVPAAAWPPQAVCVFKGRTADWECMVGEVVDRTLKKKETHATLGFQTFWLAES